MVKDNFSVMSQQVIKMYWSFIIKFYLILFEFRVNLILCLNLFRYFRSIIYNTFIMKIAGQYKVKTYCVAVNNQYEIYICKIYVFTSI